MSHKCSSFETCLLQKPGQSSTVIQMETLKKRKKSFCQFFKILYHTQQVFAQFFHMLLKNFFSLIGGYWPYFAEDSLGLYAMCWSYYSEHPSGSQRKHLSWRVLGIDLPLWFSDSMKCFLSYDDIFIGYFREIQFVFTDC